MLPSCQNIFQLCISHAYHKRLIQMSSIFQNHLSFPQACEKSEALLDYIARFPDKLMLDCYGKPLREWLTDIRWLKPRQEKPIFYPENLQWWVFSFFFLFLLFFFIGERGVLSCASCLHKEHKDTEHKFNVGYW